MNKGLVISGGGARGLFAIQILKNMKHDCFNFSEIKTISGVSVGSIIGAMVVQGDLDICLNMFRQIKNKDVYKGKLNIWNVLKSLLFGKNYVLDIEPLYNTLKKYISLNKAKNSNMDFNFGIVDLEAGVYKSFNKNDFIDNENYIRAIMASCSQELIWKPQSFFTKFEKINFGSDGGIVTVSPISSVLHDSIDEIIIINNTPNKINKDSNLNKLHSIAYRMLNIMLNSSFNKDLKTFIERNGDKRHQRYKYRIYQTSLNDDGLDFDNLELIQNRINDANLQYTNTNQNCR